MLTHKQYLDLKWDVGLLSLIGWLLSSFGSGFPLTKDLAFFFTLTYFVVAILSLIKMMIGYDN